MYMIEGLVSNQRLTVFYHNKKISFLKKYVSICFDWEYK